MKDIEDPFYFQFSLSNNVHQEPYLFIWEKKQIQRHFLVYRNHQQSYLVLSWKKIIVLSNFTEITSFNNGFEPV